MPEILEPAIRDRLRDRREAVEGQITRGGRTPDLERLLREVDDALARLADGTYGLCETCHDPVEADRLSADPLVRFCLDHLTAAEQRALERDLELAAKIQRGLLPGAGVQLDGWAVAYHYQPAGVVSGDYCDYVVTEAGDLYFMLGDVSGKGVAASMLMSHLHATLRTLIPIGLPLDELMARASRLFCESAPAAQYATLVCGRATREGAVEISNAGHPPPLVIRQAGVQRVQATGLPVGMFRAEHFALERLALQPGDTLLMYSDGVLEAQDPSGSEYGGDRLSAVATAVRTSVPTALMQACLDDLRTFRAGAKAGDDETMMAIRRS
jgi:sigma-B regulation protein RsbU (phosphoserine phosphatase)